MTAFSAAPSGGFALAALALNSTINRNASSMKPAYYTTGSAYDMGFALGAVAEPSVSILSSTYLDHIVPSLIDEGLDEWLQNSTLAPVYDILIDALADLLVNDTQHYLAASVAAGAIDPLLVAEMRGLADGAAHANPATPATFNRIAALNYGYDMLLALIFEGEIFALLGAKAAARGASAAALQSLRSVPRTALRPPAFCNAFLAGGAAVQGGGGLWRATLCLR